MQHDAPAADVLPAGSVSPQGRAALTDLVVRGMSRGAPAEELLPLVAAGLVLVKGPVVMPTPAATSLVGGWLRLPDAAPEREALTRAFHPFLPVNRRLRDLCTAWQCRPDGSVNDHTEPAYDADVRDRLDDVHESVLPLLRRMADACSRFSGYPARLEAALERLDDGDNAWFASPLVDSYHTVWMHLHQELILTLGLTREEDEALEERLVGGGAA